MIYTDPVPLDKYRSKSLFHDSIPSDRGNKTSLGHH